MRRTTKHHSTVTAVLGDGAGDVLRESAVVALLVFALALALGVLTPAHGGEALALAPIAETLWGASGG